MSEQDNSIKSIGTKVESNEGERRLLSCNKANTRSPSLEFIHEEDEDAALDYLASILVQAFFDYKEYVHRTDENKTGRNILPGIH